MVISYDLVCLEIKSYAPPLVIPDVPSACHFLDNLLPPPRIWKRLLNRLTHVYLSWRVYAREENAAIPRLY